MREDISVIENFSPGGSGHDKKQQGQEKRGVIDKRLHETKFVVVFAARLSTGIAPSIHSDSFFTLSMTSFGWFNTSRICVSTSAPVSVSRSRRLFFASSIASGSVKALR